MLETKVGYFENGNFVRGYYFSEADDQTKGFKQSADGKREPIELSERTALLISIELNISGEECRPNYRTSGWSSRKIQWWRGDYFLGSESREEREKILFSETYNYFIGPLSGKRAEGFGIYLAGSFTYVGNFFAGRPEGKGVFVNDAITRIGNAWNFVNNLSSIPPSYCIKHNMI